VKPFMISSMYLIMRGVMNLLRTSLRTITRTRVATSNNEYQNPNIGRVGIYPPIRTQIGNIQTNRKPRICKAPRSNFARIDHLASICRNQRWLFFILPTVYPAVSVMSINGENGIDHLQQGRGRSTGIMVDQRSLTCMAQNE
jgi:hypothetical protein